MTAISKARPKNGTVVGGNISWGRCYFKVTAGDQDVVLKIQNTKNSSKYELVFIRAGQKKSIKVTDGTYSVKIASGKYYFDKTHLFGDNTVYKSFGTVDFETTHKGNTVYFWYMDLNLTKTSGSSISASNF